MKRSASALEQITYSSSSDDDREDSPASVQHTLKKRYALPLAWLHPEVCKLTSACLSCRKLPALSENLKVTVPIDDPSKHQGRVRTTPHVDGQWAAHVYVHIKLSTQHPLNKLLKQAFEVAKTEVPSIQEIPGAVDEKGRRTLHVSLSRPIYLRAHQRDDLKRAVKGVAGSHNQSVLHHNNPLLRKLSHFVYHSFKLSFSTFSQFTNDERTRTFLAIHVSAGHSEVGSIFLV